MNSATRILALVGVFIISLVPRLTSAAPSFVPAAVQPTPPTNFGVSIDADGYARLQWTDSANEISYRVERSFDGLTSWSPVATIAANTISYTDTATDCETVQHYRVVALGNAGEAVPSSSRSVTNKLSCFIDWSYGTRGRTYTQIPNANPANFVFALDGAAQPDGKMIVVGRAIIGTGYAQTILRYTAAGALDSTFGGTGVITHSGSTSAEYSSVLVQDDGNILAAGKFYSGSEHVSSIRRYMPDGTVDPVFGSRTYNLAPLTESIEAIALQSDGKVVLYIVANNELFIARLNSDGTVDTTFGTNGLASTGLHGTTSHSLMSGVAVQPDGSILAAGNLRIGNDEDAAVVRLTSSGALDTDFGVNGIFSISLSINPSNLDDYARNLVVLPDGKILIGAGDLLRLNANGTLDTTFGVGGIAEAYDAQDFVVLPDSRIVTVFNSLSSDEFQLRRYTADGLPDMSEGLWVLYDGAGNYDDSIMGGIVHISQSRVAVILSTESGLNNHGFSLAAYDLGAFAAGAPTNLQATPSGRYEINLSWQNNGSLTSYRIERYTSAQEWMEIGAVGGTETTFTAVYSCESPVQYRVRGHDRASNRMTVYSNIVNATTGTCPPPPSDVAATAASHISVNVTWTDNTPDETNFEVFRSGAPTAAGTKVATVAADVTAATISGLNCGQTYYFSVRAVMRPFTYSGYSSPAMVVPPCPAAPTDVQVSAATRTSIQLTWTDTNPDETHTYLEVSASGVSGWSQLAALAPNVTTYTHTNLACSYSALYYRLRTYVQGENAYSAYSPVINASTSPCPNPPSDLTVTDVTLTTVTLSWVDNSPDETKFYIDQFTGYTWTVLGTVNADITTFTDTSMICQSSRTYRVRAYSGVDDRYSVPSGSATATTLTCPLPPAPSALTAAPLMQTAVKLSWADNSADESSYIIERSTNGVSGWAVDSTLSANITNATVSAPYCGFTAYFRVRAYRSRTNQYSDPSNVVAGSSTPCLINAPTDLTSSQVTPSSFHLQWKDNSPNESQFYVERSLDGLTGWTVLTAVDGGDTEFGNYTLTGLTCNTTSYYRVRAFRAGDSQFSQPTNVIAVTTPLCAPPTAPSGLTATALSVSQIRINWVDNSNETSFVVEGSADNVEWDELATLGANVTTYTEAGLECQAVRYYRVIAVRSGDGQSSTSAVISATSGTCLPGTPTTFTVNTTADTNDGSCTALQCSLREAISAANANSGKDTIAFNIAGSAPHVINLATDLPQITDAVIINGASEPDYAGKPVIHLLGNISSAADGLYLRAGNSEVRGLAISGFSDAAIYITQGGGNIIQGNFIGTNIAGTAAAPANGRFGIVVNSDNNLIGGSTPADRNIVSGFSTAYDPHGISINGQTTIQGNYIGTDVTGTVAIPNRNGITTWSNVGSLIKDNLISGNTGHGIYLHSFDDVIQGNLIGTNVTGTVALPNREDGIFSHSGSGYLIGGTGAGQRNIISGNLGDGITLFGTTPGSDTIQGNYIGLDITGTKALGNGGRGIFVWNGQNNLIGGTDPSAANVIVNNGNTGIEIFSSYTSNNTIQGNFIGITPAGVPMGNAGNGIGVQTPNLTSIGGDGSAMNVIAHNTGDGIHIYGLAPTPISANRIFANGGLGIDITLTAGEDGVTPNDAGDANLAYGAQNFPVISAATLDAGAGTVNIVGTLSSKANTAFVLRFYANTTCDPSAHGEGQYYLGTTNVTSNGSGSASFNVTLPAAGSAAYITATATSGGVHTSEFSACFRARDASGIPSAVTATTVTSGIFVGWQDNSLDESSFRIERSSDGTNWSAVGTVNANTTSFIDGSAPCVVLSYYRVVAIKSAGGEYPPSQSASGYGSFCPLLAPPTNLTVTGIAGSNVTLTWTDNSSDETEFRIEKMVAYTNVWTVVGSVGANVTTFTDTTPKCDLVYYRVRAYRALDQKLSATTNHAEATLSACSQKPLGRLPVNTISGNQFTFVWDDQPGAVRYQLSVSNASNILVNTFEVGSEVTCVALSCSVDAKLSLLRGSYLWTVKAWNGIGWGPASDAVSFTITGPVALTVTSPLDNVAWGTLRWAITNAASGDCINFDLAKMNANTITLTANLPQMTAGGVTVDGWDTNGGAGCGSANSGTPAVQINGSNSYLPFNILSANNVIRGLVIHNGVYAIQLYGSAATNNHIYGNYLNTDLTGTTAIIDDYDPIVITGAPNNIIGVKGDGIHDAAERNVISGEIEISAGTATGNRISGNYLGIAADGVTRIDPYGAWITTRNSANNNIIGTNGDGVSDTLEGNRISGSVSLETTGNVAAGNRIIGTLYLRGASNMIGFDGTGSAAAERNILSTINITVGGNTIAGNYIGVDQDGVTPLGGSIGITLVSTFTNIIGTNGNGVGDPYEGNVISGFTSGEGIGIKITGSQAGGSQNVIAGNYIGVGADGVTVVPNITGIQVENASRYNRIGTNGNGISDAAERNIISGNTTGIRLLGGGNTVAGNYIGLGKDGATTVPNQTGIRIDRVSSTSNIIGYYGSGSSSNGTGNVISGNTTAAIHITTGATNYGSFIAANRIGTAADGTSPRPNGTGILIDGTSANDKIGFDGDGTAAVEGNTIWYNTNAGISLGATVTKTRISANSIYANGGLGIDQASALPNSMPVINGATSEGGQTVITGIYGSQIGQTFTLEFYASPLCDPSTYGEGKTYLGAKTITLTTYADANFTATFAASVPEGHWVTALAIDSTGKSSPFSRCWMARRPAPATPTNAASVALTESSARITWTDNTTTESYYEIERSIALDPTWTKIGQVNANQTTFDDLALTCGIMHYYRVRAYRSADGQYSAYSAIVRASYPCAPENLQAERAETQVALDWVDTSAVETGYSIERRPDDSAAWTQIGQVAADGTNYTDSAIDCKKDYDYRVRASGEGNVYSTYSEAVTAAATCKPTRTPTPTPSLTPTLTLTPSMTPTLAAGVLGAGFYQENHAALIYNPAWVIDNNGSANGGSYRYTNISTAKVSFAFAGEKLTLYRAMAFNRGAMQVCIDGACATVQNYSANVIWQAAVSFNVMAGTHSVEIRNASTAYIDLDAVRVEGSAGSGPTSTPTLTVTPSSTPTATNTATATGTAIPSSTPTLTATPSSTPTATNTATATGTSTPSSTPTLTSTPTVTVTPSSTPTATNTATATQTPTQTNTLAANVLGAGFYQETHAALIYNPAWQIDSNSSASGGSYRYTNAANATVSFTFAGEKLTLYRAVAFNRGAMQVCIDGTCQMVNNYSANVIWQAMVSFNVMAGTHTVEIRNASSAYIDLDAVRVEGSAGSAPTNTATTSYTPTLTLTAFPTLPPTATLDVTATATLTPTATATATASSTLTATPTQTQTQTATLTASPTVTPTLTNTLPVSQGLTAGLYQENNAGITLTGTWTVDSSASASGGQYRFTVSPTAKASFTFTGNKLTIYRAMAFNRGAMQVCIDATCQTVQNYSASVIWQAPVSFTVAQGTHSVEIRNTSSNAIDLDAVLIEGSMVATTPIPSLTPTHTLTPSATPTKTPTPTVTATATATHTQPAGSGLGIGLYQENHTGVTFIGAWTPHVFGSASGGEYRYTNDPSARVNFTFTGSKLTLYRALAYNRGSMLVCIDGTCHSVNNYSASVIWQAPVSFTVAAGTHTVEIRNGSSAYIDLDAIRIE